MLSFDFEPPDPPHRLVSNLRRARVGFWLGIHFSVFSVVSCLTALLRSEVLPRWGRLRMPAYYRSCGQSGDYPEGQIYQQEINCKHRSFVQPEESRAAHRQKEQEQCE